MSLPFGMPTIARLSADGLEHVLEERCRFVRYDARRSDWTPIDVPPKLVKRLLATAPTQLEIPSLIHILQAPTLRPDGTVFDQPDYDPQTGLLLDTGGVEFPPISVSPSREEALVAPGWVSVRG